MTNDDAPTNQNASQQWAAVDALFDELLDLPTEERAAHLERVTAAAPVKQQLRRMLTALETRADFLEHPPSLIADDDPQPVADYSSLNVGAPVGAFVVDWLIGRGGMGEVYLAHREHAGFEQKVALKLMRPEAAARMAQFEAERRILAALEHPGIARLIDGGLSPDGRPYMAMEFIDGLDIIAYARAHALDLPARLELFRQVCDAVDHAHRNLVVHRDLKPANILVTADGRVKLLDFGIAKLIDATTIDGLPTQAMLTPEYAAPEQMEGGPITTATDVFALGILLYELLAGVRPWQLQGLPLPGALRRMLEAEPSEPSAAGKSDAPVPVRLIRGDLDAIVLKAVRREPAARYRSAAQLWADIERHQQLRPVLARGDAGSYRLRRFMRRYRLLVASTVAVILALSAGLIGMTWQAQRIAQERDQVLAEVGRAEAVRNYILLMFRTAGENQGDQPLTAKQVLDASAKRLSEQYRDQPRTRAQIQQALGTLYLYLNDFDGAAPLLRGYLKAPGEQAPADRAEVSALLAEVELGLGNNADARRLLDAAQTFWKTDAARYRKPLIASRQLQARIEKEEHGLAASIRTLQAAVAEHDAYFGRRNTETANVLNSLGIAYQANGDIDLADAAFKDSWAVHQALGNQRTAAALLTLGNWATVAYRKKDLPRAERLLQQATTTRRALYGNSAALAAMQANLGKIVLRAGRPQDALVQLQQALPMSLQYTGEHSPLTVAILQGTAEAQIALHQFEPAALTLTRAKDAARANSGENQVLYALCLGIEARLNQALGKLQAAQNFASVMESTIVALGDAGKPYLPEIARLRAELAATR